MSVMEQTYERLALEDGEHRWELLGGVLQEKPAMAHGHQRAFRHLDHQLHLQVDWSRFEISVDSSRVQHTEQNYFIPDLFVVPVAYIESYRGRDLSLEFFADPLPLVVEIWSPSTGRYDIDLKIPTYRARGDLEIWRLHPYERTLTVWRRQSDGSYSEAVYRGGKIALAALPGVTIDLDDLFD